MIIPQDNRAAPSPRQREAVARLVGYCEGLCRGGQLGELVELGLRENIARALAAFDMPAEAESHHAN